MATQITPKPAPRIAVWTDESFQANDGTFTVVACEANQPGYWPISPGWTSLETAQQWATSINEAAGCTEAQALEIRASSMAAHTTHDQRERTR